MWGKVIPCDPSTTESGLRITVGHGRDEGETSARDNPDVQRIHEPYRLGDLKHEDKSSGQPNLPWGAPQNYPFEPGETLRRAMGASSCDGPAKLEEMGPTRLVLDMIS